MALLSLKGIQQGYGGPLLLEDVQLQIEERERIALIGRNGVGKSTLFGIINGDIQADGGEIWRCQSLRVATLPQNFPADLNGSVRKVVAGTLEGWEHDHQIDKVITRLSLDPEADYTALSGGFQRRVLLARALSTDPDLLLLDEPTNHLDLETIEWFENMLNAYQGCVLFTTHDRRFLERLASRIVELDRGRVSSWPGDYRNYLRRREERLNAEQLENNRFDKKLAAEEIWIRQGIKARRTRNEGRVRQLEELRRQRQARRTQPGTVRMQVHQGDASGKRVIEVQDVDAGYGDQILLKNFSTLIQRGDRIAIIGPNGAGKTTLLKVLLGQLAPLRGEVIQGVKLRLAYFDQHRQQLDPNLSVFDNVAQGKQEVMINNRPRHVMSYLQDFLFSAPRARSPVSVLSGGERNRLLLARLFAQPSNLLVLDEPTNDLDLETLELLEDLLGEYSGTLLLVSHDRQFIDNIATSTLVLEGDGRIGDYVGGYQDWLRQRPQANKTAAQSQIKSPQQKPKPKTAKKLSYRQQRELDSLPASIELLEKKVGELQNQMSQSRFYQQDADSIASANAELQATQNKLNQRYQLWSELEALEQA